MATSKDELFRRALQLTETERAELAGMLLDSLEPPADRNIEQSWLTEIERRMEQLDSGQAKPIPWERVRARLSSRIDE